MSFKERVTGKLEKLREYAGYSKIYQWNTLDDLRKDPTLQGAVKRYFHLSAECVIDIAEMLIAELGLRKPEEYKEAIEILGEAKILPDEFADRFAPIAGFRNILGREYPKIDLTVVYRHMKEDIDDFKKCARHIAEYLQNNR